MKNIKTQNNTNTINYQQLTTEIILQKYPYILLGAAIIVVIFLVTIGYLKKSNITQIIKPINTTKQQIAKTEIKTENPTKTYIVKAGDDLWNIAENFYGSGFNAYEIAATNNIINPSIIEIGQKLVIPSLTPKTPTTGEIVSASTSQVKFPDAKYTTKTGDFLWKIAEDAYGDGMLWVKIAKANNIEDPNIIHTGNVLIIPRD